MSRQRRGSKTGRERHTLPKGELPPERLTPAYAERMTAEAFAAGSAARRALANAASVAAGLAPPPGRAANYGRGDIFNISHELPAEYKKLQPGVVPDIDPGIFDNPIDYTDCRISDDLYEQLGGVQRPLRAGKPPMQDVSFGARCKLNPLIKPRKEYNETDHISDCPIYAFIITPSGHAFILILAYVELGGGGGGGRGTYPMAFSLGVGVDYNLGSILSAVGVGQLGIFSPDFSFRFERPEPGFRIIDVGLFKKKHADRIEEILKTQSDLTHSVNLELIDKNFARYFVSIKEGVYSLASPEGGIKGSFFNCVSFAQYVFDERVECIDPATEQMVRRMTKGLLADPRLAHPDGCKRRDDTGVAAINAIQLYANALTAFYNPGQPRFNSTPELLELFQFLNADTIRVRKTGKIELCYTVAKHAACALVAAGSAYVAWRFMGRGGGGKTRKGKRQTTTRRRSHRFKALEA